jgi:hypothetical protein
MPSAAGSCPQAVSTRRKNVLPKAMHFVPTAKRPRQHARSRWRLAAQRNTDGPECILACASASASQQRTPKQRRGDEPSADAKMPGCSGATKASMQAQQSPFIAQERHR